MLPCMLPLSISMHTHCFSLLFFFFNDTATTEIYTLSLHDALPIWPCPRRRGGTARCRHRPRPGRFSRARCPRRSPSRRSEEHTSELQSRLHLVCRLLLEKKKKNKHEYAEHSTQHYIEGEKSSAAAS